MKIPEDDSNSTTIVKPKRGRKPKNVVVNNVVVSDNINPVENIALQILNESESLEKKEIVLNQLENLIVASEEKNEQQPVQGKKRGRKPKGGKIIQQILVSASAKEPRPNVILHLKCSIKDLKNQNTSSSSNIESFHFSGNKNDLNFDVISTNNVESTIQNTFFGNNTNNNTTNYNSTDIYDDSDYEEDYNDDPKVLNKQIWKKLKSLEHNLHINNISDKKSACFWCTCDFDNPPVYIPKYYMKESYHVYGCYCSPECAVAFLMEENIDTSTKFERYHLLNHIYAKIYDYKNNIKPAPNVYYMLDKYYGNLSIQEYRSLLRNERFFLVVDKPLTRILPELHEDNECHIINKKIIPSNNLQIKRKVQKKTCATKTNILLEKFGGNAPAQ